jgi:hypothetical protein
MLVNLPSDGLDEELEETRENERTVNAHQGVRRPAPCDRFFTQRDKSNFCFAWCEMLISSDFSGYIGRLTASRTHRRSRELCFRGGMRSYSYHSIFGGVSWTATTSSANSSIESPNGASLVGSTGSKSTIIKLYESDASAISQ